MTTALIVIAVLAVALAAQAGVWLVIALIAGYRLKHSEVVNHEKLPTAELHIQEGTRLIHESLKNPRQSYTGQCSLRSAAYEHFREADIMEHGPYKL